MVVRWQDRVLAKLVMAMRRVEDASPALLETARRIEAGLALSNPGATLEALAEAEVEDTPQLAPRQRQIRDYEPGTGEPNRLWWTE